MNFPESGRRSETGLLGPRTALAEVELIGRRVLQYVQPASKSRIMATKGKWVTFSSTIRRCRKCSTGKTSRSGRSTRGMRFCWLLSAPITVSFFLSGDVETVQSFMTVANDPSRMAKSQHYDRPAVTFNILVIGPQFTVWPNQASFRSWRFDTVDHVVETVSVCQRDMAPNLDRK